MRRRLVAAAAAPVAAALGVAAGALVARPLADRLARRLMAAPRRLPDEALLAPEADALGGEAVSLRSRDGVRLAGRWLPAEAAAGPSAGSGPGDDWIADPHEAIVLLHGWSGSVLPDLVEYAPFLRTVAGVLGLDFRGHGGSGDGPTTFGLLEVEDVAGALDWLGERGIRRVALVGSSMGGITALAALAVLGDGRLASADAVPDAPAGVGVAPRPRIVAVVADSVAPELEIAVGSRVGFPGGRRLARLALSRFPHLVGGDPRATEPIAVIGLAEDVPLLLVHGAADPAVRPVDGTRLAAAAPRGTRHVVVAGAGHAGAHAVDPDVWESTAREVLQTGFASGRA